MSKREKRDEKIDGKSVDPGFVPPPYSVSCMLPILTVAALIVLVLVCAHMWQRNLIGSTIVPDVKGLEAERAEELIRSANLLPEIVSGIHFDENIADGCVISTEPEAKRTVKQGRIVRILVSKGGKNTKVPEIKGLNLREVSKKITDAGLLVGDIEREYNSEFDIEQVISVDPKPGTVLERNTKVNIIVSKGSEDGVISGLKPDDGTGLKQGDDAPLGRSREYKINLTIPHTVSMKADNLKIVVTDAAGERVEYEGFHNPGDNITYNIGYTGKARIEVTFGETKLLDKRL